MELYRHLLNELHRARIVLLPNCQLCWTMDKDWSYRVIGLAYAMTSDSPFVLSLPRLVPADAVKPVLAVRPLTTRELIAR